MPIQEKLQKLLAHAGHGSRREIEKWIADGRVSLNGKRAKTGDRASHEDRILIDGRLISLAAKHSEQLKALIYHKPEGEICTRKDPKGRPTVFENLPAIPNGRWVSVGRLDINTSGLLLFTNNGELANKLMHPSTGLEREYLVRIRGTASEETIQTLTRKGVSIDGRDAKFESVNLADMSEEGTNHWYRVVIKEGRYREVRRLWDAVGHTVSRLKRIRYGTIKLTRDLKQGHVVKMAPMQLEKMITAVGLQSEFNGQLYSGLRSGGSQKSTRQKPIKQESAQRNNKSTSSKKTRATQSSKKRSSTEQRKFERSMDSGTGSKRSRKSSRKPR